MPNELVSSGPDFMRDNQMVSPMARIYFCEGCGAKNAPFLVKRGDDVLSYCGWENGHPVCVGAKRN